MHLWDGVVALHEPTASPSQPRVTSQPRVNHESSKLCYFVPKKYLNINRKYLVSKPLQTAGMSADNVRG